MSLTLSSPCLYVCCMQVCACTCGSHRKEPQMSCSVTPTSPFEFWSSPVLCLGWPVSKPQASSSYPLLLHGPYGKVRVYCALTWLLGIQTQVPMLEQFVLLPRKPCPPPRWYSSHRALVLGWVDMNNKSYREES